MNVVLFLGTIFVGLSIVALWAIILRNIVKALSRLERTVDRIEAAADVVAQELAMSQRRADKIDTGIPGEAADAGAQSGTNQGGTGE